MREIYQRYATQQGVKKLTPEKFGCRLSGLTDFNIKDGRIRGGENRVRGYNGVELTPCGQQIV